MGRKSRHLRRMRGGGLSAGRVLLLMGEINVSEATKKRMTGRAAHKFTRPDYSDYRLSTCPKIAPRFRNSGLRRKGMVANGCSGVSGHSERVSGKLGL